MSKDFLKSLDPYETSGGTPVKGKYHFDIPHDIEPDCYEMTIDYESHDEVNPDAYQYEGFIVVGHRAYLRAPVIHIPFDTGATTEEAITLYEKRNTTFSAVCEAFKNSDFTGAVKQLPLDIRFNKGDFKDYYAMSNPQSEINSDYNSAYESQTKPNPVKTNNSGKSTTTFKISDVYNVEESINDINTIYFKLNGTKDRGSDNYVPAIIEAPCILGTTHVSYYKYTGNDTDFLRINRTDVNFALPSDEDHNADSEYLIATCGRGKTLIGTDLIYRFAQTVTYTAKTNYEHYITDPNYHCKVGKFYLGWREYTEGTHEEYTLIPASQLEAANEHTTILSDGAIIQTPGNESGGVRVYWTNQFANNTSKPIQYRWEYKGEVGATYDLESPDYGMIIDPRYGTPSVIETKITMSSNSYTSNPQEPVTISGTVQQKLQGSWTDPTNHDGRVIIKEGNTVLATLRINSEGEFSTQITKPTGSYNFVAEFHDYNENLDDSSKTFTLSVRSPLAVTINPSTSNGNSLRADAYDSGTGDSHTIAFTLTDELGRPVERGNLEIFLKSKHWELAGMSRTSVANLTVQNGAVTVNSFNLFTNTFKNKFIGGTKNMILHTRYGVTVKYTDSSGRYATQTNLNLSGSDELSTTYRPKDPRLILKLSAKAPGADSYTELTNTTFTQFKDLGTDSQGNSIPNGDLGFRTPFVIDNNSEIKLEFHVENSSGQRIGGINYHKWLNADHFITIYQQNADGTFRLTSNGNKIPYTTAKRYVKVCENVFNEETEQLDRVCEEVETPLLLKDCYPVLPIPPDTLMFNEDPVEVTSKSQNNVITFQLPEECNQDTTMFLGLSYHALWIFGSASNYIVHPVKSITAQYHKDTNPNDDVDTSYWDEILLGSTNENKQFANPVTHQYGVIFNFTFRDSSYNPT